MTRRGLHRSEGLGRPRWRAAGCGYRRGIVALFEAGKSRLELILAETFRTRDRDSWLAIPDAADVPSSAINSVPEAIGDPQVRHRGMIAEVPEGSGRRFVRVPILRPGEPGRTEAPAPRLGEHTDEILAGLGLNADDIARLRSSGAI